MTDQEIYSNFTLLNPGTYSVTKMIVRRGIMHLLENMMNINEYDILTIFILIRNFLKLHSVDSKTCWCMSEWTLFL